MCTEINKKKMKPSGDLSSSYLPCASLRIEEGGLLVTPLSLGSPSSCILLCSVGSLDLPESVDRGLVGCWRNSQDHYLLLVLTYHPFTCIGGTLLAPPGDIMSGQNDPVSKTDIIYELWMRFGAGGSLDNIKVSNGWPIFTRDKFNIKSIGWEITYSVQ